MQSFHPYSFTINEIENRVDGILAAEQKTVKRTAILKSLLGMIDLTTLSGDDTEERVKTLSRKALSYKDETKGIPHVAAVCVYPVFARTVSDALNGTGVNTACVAGAFPSGQSPLPIRIKEVEFAIGNGADEIDMVISRGKLIEGDDDFVWDEVSQIKTSCGDVHLKVILETGELKTVELIRRASELAILGGGDFLKTSTGKIQPSATPEAFLIMLDTIKEFYDKTGVMIGIKAAGGISEPDDAIRYYLLVKNVLGEQWLSPDHFRIGASRLADKLMEEIQAGTVKS